MRRRSFLQTLAASAFAARGLSAGGDPPIRRLVLLMQPSGTHVADFWPDAELRSRILEPLVSNASIRAKTTVVKGLYVPFDTAGTDGNQHDVGFARMFTGHPLLNVAGHPWGGGPSVDQLIARASGQSSLALAVVASAAEPHPKPGFDHRRSFSYVAPGVHKVPILDPFVAFQTLFPQPRADETRRLALRKSVLDSVSGDLRDLSSRLGAHERAKIDLHLTSIAELEKRVAPGPACGRVPKPPRDFSGTAPELLVNSDAAIPELTDAMIDLAAAAIACDRSRIVTLQLGYAGSRWAFPWLGIPEEFHAYIAHSETTDAGSSPEKAAKAVTVNRWFAERVARLVNQLDAIPEGSGTVLDTTLVVWANEMGRGDHSLENVPIVFIGGPLKRGGRLIDVGRQPFQRLGCSLLQLHGIAAEGFGDLPDCGPIRGLT